MALKFRLQGLAETFIDQVLCPNCGIGGSDDENFTSELTKVTLEGIVVVLQCRVCCEIFVPPTQRLGILDSRELRKAVEKDWQESGEPPLPSVSAVRLNAEKLNALRRGDLH